jgi:hypothetical protein
MLAYILVGILVILCITIQVASLVKHYNNKIETFRTLSPEEFPTKDLLLDDIYEGSISKDTISKYNTAVWKQKQPIKVGSYDQQTNNIEYPINPDNGSCIPSEFCYSFYSNNRITPNTQVSNMIIPTDTDNPPYTPPITPKVRVGYFSTSTGEFF